MERVCPGGESMLRTGGTGGSRGRVNVENGCNVT